MGILFESKKGHELHAIGGLSEKPLYRVTQWYSMALSRKHFEAIAKILKDHKADGDLILAMSSEMVNHNPRFNTHKFCVASGYWED